MNLTRHKQLLKDWKKAKITDGQLTKFIYFAECLRADESWPPASKDHALQGEYDDCREFHLGGDMLVIYMVKGKNEEITFLRLATHT